MLQALKRGKNLDYYLQRVQELSPRVIVKKVLVKPTAVAVRKLEKVKAKFSSTHISDKELIESLNGFNNHGEVLNQLRGDRPRFFIDSADKGELISLFRNEMPQSEEQVISEADKVCSHTFDLLGSGDVNLDDFVKQRGGYGKCGYLPWHFDFKSTYKWNPKKYYKEIEIPYGKADIKVPWELSRFHHAVTLGQAYWLTNDEKYAKEFVRQVKDWIDNNPPKFGVNWRCTMDVAIRVTNWIWGFYFFKDSAGFDNDFLIKFLKGLLIHGRHIMSNLENTGQVTTNHYLSDLVGLIYLGITFPEFKEAKKWREFGIREMINEMEKQVYEDGMDFEASTCYHRLVLELFFFPTLLCQLNDIELANDFMEKFKKMFDFVLYVLKPNGRMPQIGDNDNGRLHVVGKRDILDMTYLLTFATLFFDDPKYKIKEFGFAPEALWLFGPESHERWHEMPGRSVEELKSKAFREGGIYIMRHKKDYMAISCGPNGQNGNGGHAHNDKLSFELCVDGEDVIVDSGTYVYTADPEWRRRFRSTAYHNTIAVDNVEQQDFDGIFGMKQSAFRAVPIVEKWLSEKEFVFFEGIFDGYDRLDDYLAHKRQVYYDKFERFWLIIDHLYAENPHSYDHYFHFNQLNVQKMNTTFDTSYLKKVMGKYDENIGPPSKLGISKQSSLNGPIYEIQSNNQTFLLAPLDSESLEYQLTEEWISPCYGVKKRAPVLYFSKDGSSTIEFATLFIPHNLGN